MRIRLGDTERLLCIDLAGTVDAVRLLLDLADIPRSPSKVNGKRGAKKIPPRAARRDRSYSAVKGSRATWRARLIASVSWR